MPFEVAMDLRSGSRAGLLHRYRRPIRWAAIVAGVALLFHIAGGWYFSGQIHGSALEPDPSTVDLDIPILALGESTITLSTTEGPDELQVPAIWGLAWEGGYGQLTDLITSDEEQVEWQFQVMIGSPPTVGDLADLDVKAYPGDPLSAHGIPFTDVNYASDLGVNPAWFVEGDRETWVVLVHGNGLTRRDVLKPLPAIVQAGYPALAITYRNHPQAPPDPTGRLQYGLTEWTDLEAAVEFALSEGAEEVVLVGYSMGGGIVTSFLLESPVAERVSGAVLDAPMLDLGAAVDLGAENRSLPLIGLPIPDSLTATAKWIAGLRYDVEWGRLDYLKRAGELDVPILLFHGTDDDIVPVKTSDALAELLPALVEYHRVDGAEHLESWNLDPAQYERLLTQFLSSL